MSDQTKDPINHPPHYTSRAVECIEVAEMLPFCQGNAVKYIWRAGEKDDELEDLRKAEWYLVRAINGHWRNSSRNSNALIPLSNAGFADWRSGVLWLIVCNELESVLELVRARIAEVENDGE